jgi:hypothetical protein
MCPSLDRCYCSLVLNLLSDPRFVTVIERHTLNFGRKVEYIVAILRLTILDQQCQTAGRV